MKPHIECGDHLNTYNLKKKNLKKNTPFSNSREYLMYLEADPPSSVEISSIYSQTFKSIGISLSLFFTPQAYTSLLFLAALPTSPRHPHDSEFQHGFRRVLPNRSIPSHPSLKKYSPK